MRVIRLRTHLQRELLNYGVFLSALLLLTLTAVTSALPSPGGHTTTSFEQLFSTDPNNATFTPVCDDVQLRNVAQQVTQLKLSSENIFFLLEAYNLRLDNIKLLLDARLPEVKSTPHWIDVRVGEVSSSGGSVSSAQNSAGKVHFPSINTKSNACGVSSSQTSAAGGNNIPLTNSQSSAGGANSPVSSSQSSAGGANLPVLNTQSSAGGINLPATSSQSSAGGNNIQAAHANETASATCGCNQQKQPLAANSYAALPSGLYGALCPYSSPVLSTTCAEAIEQAGTNAKSGIYHLHLPDAGLKPFYAYCLLDPKGGPAWTVIQRRQDGSINFHRTWVEYQAGFGNWNGEFFIGLERLYGITHAQLNELWVQMEDFENVTRYARYDNFAIGDEHEAYALHLLGSYEGNAGDSLRVSQGQMFSTKDADYDMWDRNCAVEYTGAWWYKACHDSNLNGQYLRGKYGSDKYGKGIDWTHWHGHEYSLKYVHMAVRPVQQKV